MGTRPLILLLLASLFTVTSGINFSATANNTAVFKEALSWHSAGFNDFYGVWFDYDNAFGCISGSNGTILITTDFGQHWSRKASGTYQDLVSVDFINKTSGWIVGSQGVMLSTSNAGQDWTTREHVTNNNLYKIFFTPDGKHGWAVGDDGTVINTSDGGDSWNLQQSFSSDALYGIAFDPSGTVGWIVGFGGSVLTTVDGGSHWQSKRISTSQTLTAIDFDSQGRRGFIAGFAGTLFATFDGGRNWKEQESGTGENLTTIHFDGGDRAWAAGMNGVLISTKDAGKNWAPSESGTTSAFSRVWFSSDHLKGWAVGVSDTVVSTVDGGETWLLRHSGTSADLWGVQFAENRLNGWAVGDAGTIASTEDGGKNWKVKNSPSNRTLSSVRFGPDNRHGLATGLYGTILTTSDGGEHWTTERSPTDNGLMDLAVTDGGESALIVGQHGTILARRSGQWFAQNYPTGQWVAQTSPTKESLRRVTIAKGGNKAWVVGEEGTILATEDGGITWKLQESNTNNTLFGIYFDEDAKRGWVVGEAGLILATEDGGRHWTPEASGTTKSLMDVHFSADGRRGFAVGLEGTMLETNDAGVQWKRLVPVTDKGLLSVWVSKDGLAAWAAGIKGAILFAIPPPRLDDVALPPEAGANGSFNISFNLDTDERFPAVTLVQARIGKSDSWDDIGVAFRSDANSKRWLLNWTPAEFYTREDNNIDFQLLLKYGRTSIKLPLGTAQFRRKDIAPSFTDVSNNNTSSFTVSYTGETVPVTSINDDVKIDRVQLKIKSIDKQNKTVTFLGSAKDMKPGIMYIKSSSSVATYWYENFILQFYAQPYSSSYAILVAIDDYDRKNDPSGRGPTRLRPLTNMVSGAEALRQVLIELGFPSDHIVTLYDEKATKANFEKELSEFWPNGAHADTDRLFIYFGGHGGSTGGAGTGYLATYDFESGKPQTGFPMNNFVYVQFPNIVARAVFVALDACSSGLAIPGMLSDVDEDTLARFATLAEIKAQTSQKARNLLVAGTADEPAVDYGGGIFTQALIEGLRGGADFFHDRVVQFDELSVYVEHEVIAWAQRLAVTQRPKYFTADQYGPGKVVFPLPAWH